MLLRPIAERDIPQLVSLWAGVFGDPPALAEAFLTRLDALGFGWAAVEGERVLGAAYGVDALSLEGEKCLYLYAVAVLPEARGRGLGTALSRAVFDTGLSRGAAYRCTEPAEPSLFDWYRRVLGVGPVLYRQRQTLESAPLRRVWTVTPEAYAAARESLLSGRAHIRYDAAALRYEEDNCRLFGGALFASAQGIAAAQVDGGTARIRECLGPEPEKLAASVGAALGCAKVELLSSADSGEMFLAGDRPLPPGTVWNLCFD